MSTSRPGPRQRSPCWPPKIGSPSCAMRTGDQDGDTPPDLNKWIPRCHNPGCWSGPHLAAADLARGLRSRSASGHSGRLSGRSLRQRQRLAAGCRSAPRPTPASGGVLDQTLPLSAEEETRRLFLPGFTKPGSAMHFGGVWEDLAETLDRLGEVDIDVIIDCGRLGPNGLPAALLERSAVTAVVVTSTLRSIMSAR